MWRIGVLIFAILLEVTSADLRTGVHHELAQRFKRSPQYYDCGPPGPPPPPPFWPPPPPPPHWRHPHPAPWEYQQPQNQAYSNAESNAVASGISNGGANAAPCTTCGDNGSNAVSNAKSESGQAVAVAIARASTH